jgi:hypothetical protein
MAKRRTRTAVEVGVGPEFGDPSPVAWGGIGGSGRHAADLLPEVINVSRDRRAFRDLIQQMGEITSDPAFAELLDQSPVAWGGIGGSGKHAADLLPEEVVE